VAAIFGLRLAMGFMPAALSPMATAAMSEMIRKAIIIKYISKHFHLQSNR